MSRRIRLRSRVFLMTAMYSAVLFAIAFGLTWRARTYEQQFHRIMDVDSSAVDALDGLVRAQNGWNQRWQSMDGADAATVRAVSDRYSTVRQILDSRRLAGANTRGLRDSVIAFERQVGSWSRRWESLSAAEREQARDTADDETREIVAAANSLIAIHRGAISRTLAELTLDARGMMWTALGVAWMIAILSFAAARRALTKVVRPIEDLVLAAERIAGGKLDARAPISGDQEIARLGQSFNRMADALALSHQELHQRARTDELTGLPNFRKFREAIDEEIERADRFEKQFGVLILDLDHFKQYNDTWGHLAGNEALQLVSRTIQTTVRAIDIPARYGGEEFAVILPAAESHGVATLAERVRAAIEAIPPIADRRSLTVSVGGALYPEDGATPEELFATADARLYQAKEQGRNRAITPVPDTVEA